MQKMLTLKIKSAGIASSAAEWRRRNGSPTNLQPLPSFEELVVVLPESQREVVTMLKVDGLSLEEIARVTSSTTGAVKQKAHRAYDRLRRHLERATKGPERTPPQPVAKGVTQ